MEGEDLEAGALKEDVSRVNVPRHYPDWDRLTLDAFLSLPSPPHN